MQKRTIAALAIILCLGGAVLSLLYGEARDNKAEVRGESAPEILGPGASEPNRGHPGSSVKDESSPLPDRKIVDAAVVKDIRLVDSTGRALPRLRFRLGASAEGDSEWAKEFETDDLGWASVEVGPKKATHWAQVLPKQGVSAPKLSLDFSGATRKFEAKLDVSYLLRVKVSVADNLLAVMRETQLDSIRIAAYEWVKSPDIFSPPKTLHTQISRVEPGEVTATVELKELDSVELLVQMVHGDRFKSSKNRLLLKRVRLFEQVIRPSSSAPFFDPVFVKIDLKEFLWGRVIDDEGRPLSSARIEIRGLDHQYQKAGKTMKGGAFVFRKDALGKEAVQLRAVYGPFSTKWSAIQSEEAMRLTIDCRNAWRVSVVDATGKGIARFSLRRSACPLASSIARPPVRSRPGGILVLPYKKVEPGETWFLTTDNGQCRARFDEKSRLSKRRYRFVFARAEDNCRLRIVDNVKYGGDVYLRIREKVKPGEGWAAQYLVYAGDGKLLPRVITGLLPGTYKVEVAQAIHGGQTFKSGTVRLVSGQEVFW